MTTFRTHAFLMTLSILALTLGVAGPAPDVAAVPIEFDPQVHISASYVGCSGNSAVYNLTASLTDGYPGFGFTWTNATQTSGYSTQPNTATTTVSGFVRIVSVEAVTHFHWLQDSITLTNPCKEGPGGRL